MNARNDTQTRRIALIAPSELIRTPALYRALALSYATGAVLHIIGFDYLQAITVPGLLEHEVTVRAAEQYQRATRYWLQHYGAMDAGSGLPENAELCRLPAGMAPLVKHLTDLHADLVVKDAFPLRRYEPPSLCPLDWLLLHNQWVTLHLVADERNPQPLKVLAAIDLSHLEELSQGINQGVMNVASVLATSCGAELHMLNVGNWVVIGDSHWSLPIEMLHTSLKDAIHDAQEEAFAALAERHEVMGIRQHQLSGVARDVIPCFLKQNAFDLLVMGAIMRRRPDRFLGSTAEGVLSTSMCNSIVIKPARQRR